jgi:hypothetical protein
MNEMPASDATTMRMDINTLRKFSPIVINNTTPSAIVTRMLTTMLSESLSKVVRSLLFGKSVIVMRSPGINRSNGIPIRSRIIVKITGSINYL